MIEKPKVLKCTLKVLDNRSTFDMYLSTSTSTDHFPEMYLSTFQVLYKLYLSTDVLKYKVLLPGPAVDIKSLLACITLVAPKDYWLCVSVCLCVSVFWR